MKNRVWVVTAIKSFRDVFNGSWIEQSPHEYEVDAASLLDAITDVTHNAYKNINNPNNFRFDVIAGKLKEG